MKQRPQSPRDRVFVLLVVLVLWSTTALASAEHPLAPPDRSSPRATLSSFLESVDRAWELFSADDPAFGEPFREAKECLDLSGVPPLVFREVSAESALVLKEVLDRVELPPMDEIPDAATVAELGLETWTIPRTEIRLVRVGEGENRGEWLFSSHTVDRLDEFYNRTRHLPYQPGRSGGHIEQLRSGTRAVLLAKLVEAFPSTLSRKLGGMMLWQWIGLGVLTLLVTAIVLVAVWIGGRWRASARPGRRLAAFVAPGTMVLMPFFGRFMLHRIFDLPGAPALTVRLMFSILGYIGLAWLTAVLFTRLGELAVRIFFRDARPLKKQLIRVIFRIATIVVVTGITVRALQILGVPVAGLIAGLGVGGLAIALAAQSTLENFIGGIILYADQPVKVGDICKFGDRRGTVEDVGLRSVRVRTIDNTVVTIPNAAFAKMQLENLSERDRILLREDLCLRYETTRSQLQSVLSEIESMLRGHERIDDNRLRIRLTGFDNGMPEIEIFAYAVAETWPDFLEIREDVLFKVMEIIENAGTRLALPTEVHYAAEGASGSRET